MLLIVKGAWSLLEWGELEFRVVVVVVGVEGREKLRLDTEREGRGQLCWCVVSLLWLEIGLSFYFLF